MLSEMERLISYMTGRLLVVERERNLLADRVRQLEAERDTPPEPPPATLHPVPREVA